MKYIIVRINRYLNHEARIEREHVTAVHSTASEVPNVEKYRPYDEHDVTAEEVFYFQLKKCENLNASNIG